MAKTRSVSVLFDAKGIARALRVPAYVLRVVRGPDKGKRAELSSRLARIGSAEAAEFRLGDRTVSALHCELTADLRGFRVRDLGSKNGVRLAGRRIEAAWLEDKDDLVLGNTVLRFQCQSHQSDTELGPPAGFGQLRGRSVPMRELYARLARAARSDAHVLLEGESGTGKELAAEALIREGPRPEGPLVVVDCTRLPTGLAESELFGHEKGAFSGAVKSMAGAFERAHGGTLLLDEVGELPLELQPKLLGALERKAVQRVGGARAVAVDVRVIAMSQHELEREVNRGGFRADLFYRLAAIQIRLPPLREHREDIPELVAHLMAELPGSAEALSPAALQRLYQSDYPGNVRELRNAVERAAAGLEGDVRVAPAVPVDLAQPYRLERERVMAGFERAYVGKMLEACGGNVSEAARRSGMNRVHLHEVIRRLGLRAPARKAPAPR